MSKVVKSVLLVIHPNRPEASTTATELVKLLSAKQIEVFSTVTNLSLTEFTNQKIDLAVVLGGDGTMHDIINAIMIKPEWLAIPLLLF